MILCNHAIFQMMTERKPSARHAFITSLLIHPHTVFHVRFLFLLQQQHCSRFPGHLSTFYNVANVAFFIYK